MRFKAKLFVEKVPNFLKIMQVIEKLDRTCVLHLPSPDDDGLRIVVQPDSVGAMASYAVLKRHQWFEYYRIESQNSNQIGLEMEVQNLLKALRSGAAADEMTIKLSKKGGPVLNFEILTPLGPILQDVPVNVLSAIRLQECAEPFTEAINGFMLPKFPVLHSVLERFKGLGNDLIVEADVKEESADMALAVRTDMISVCTAFNNLRRATFGGYGNTEQLAEPAEYKALIDRRNFARCVYAEALTPQYTICFVFNNSVLLHVLGGWGVTMSYYIPKKHAL